MNSDHQHFMRRCLELARQAAATGDTPVGAVVVRNGTIVAEGVESVRARRDVTAHAEIVALRAASERLGTIDLSGCTLYTSVEPCVMCAYAIRLARIDAVVCGARVDSAGRGLAALADAALLPTRATPSIVRDVLADECVAALRQAR
jgi:tRNA(adenine34) deaminase